jgi:hypothetical protein
MKSAKHVIIVFISTALFANVAKADLFGSMMGSMAGAASNGTGKFLFQMLQKAPTQPPVIPSPSPSAQAIAAQSGVVAVGSGITTGVSTVVTGADVTRAYAAFYADPAYTDQQKNTMRQIVTNLPQTGISPEQLIGMLNSYKEELRQVAKVPSLPVNSSAQIANMAEAASKINGGSAEIANMAEAASKSNGVGAENAKIAEAVSKSTELPASQPVNDNKAQSIINGAVNGAVQVIGGFIGGFLRRPAQ